MVERQQLSAMDAEVLAGSAVPTDSEEAVLQWLAGEYGLGYTPLDKIEPDCGLLARFPARILLKEELLPLREKDGVIEVAVSRLFATPGLDSLRAITSLKLSPILAPSEALQREIKRHLGVGADTLNLLEQKDFFQVVADEHQDDGDLDTAAEDASIIRFVNQILGDAISQRASDIHVEPFEHELRIRYRIDGLLQEVPVPAQIKRFQPAIVSRIKILSNLNIAEKRVPQDGRIKIRVKASEVDIRVSVIPMLQGEAVVLRLLRQDSSMIGLSGIGMAERERQIFDRVLEMPHGIALVTGPTGSGKTTTLYGALHQINDEVRKIITIDSETRSLVIVTDEDTHREMVGVIKTLDQPKPQVLIKVVFLEVTYNTGLDLGVEGSYTFNLKNPISATTGTRTTTTANTAVSGTTTTTTNSSLASDIGTAANTGRTATLQNLFGLSSLTQGSFVRLASDDWSATLHALSSKGKVEILSRPSIMARNNQEAVIVVGSEVPFITASTLTSTGQTNNTIKYDNVGIILRVTPFITAEGTVEMVVAPEISALTDQTVPIGNNTFAPVISKRSAETVVVTPHAQTVVIGGLMQTQKTSSVQKIPLLGDIPYLGAPFRRTITSDTKTELLIFLTPYILNNTAGLTRATADEMDRTELVDKSFSQRELDKYLDSMPAPAVDLETPRKADSATKSVKTAVKKTAATKAVEPATPAPVKTKPTPPPRSGNH